MSFQKDKRTPYFSFNYNGESTAEVLKNAKVTSAAKEEAVETTFVLPDGLEITQSIKEYPNYGATEWVVSLNNNSSEHSGLITELFDCDIALPFEYDAPQTPGFNVKESAAAIYNPKGSVWARDEFVSSANYILPGKTQKYNNDGGRSSNGKAPFFDINRGDKGVICAIGWTGQWQAVFSRDDENINIKTGIQNIGFKLFPGEKIRTSSMLLMRYENGQNNGHIQFRRLVKEQFSLIGKPGRPDQGPHSIMAWGALPTDQMLKRIEQYTKNKLDFEYFWIDAGWYGSPNGYCPSEHVGDWGTQTGNWAVNTNTHPDGLLEVAKAIKENGMKFLLWIEPERVISSNPTPQEHPDWFFKLPDGSGKNETWLLNLGNEEALAGTIELVSNFVKDFDLACYRQDFNMDPLKFWQVNDEPERVGMNEIKHIMGLYMFWDTLLERFPHLIIDNCASGGRRIDIETLRRSIPLWRSDYQCTWDADAETSQTHNMGISWWIPYSGTGNGFGIGDTYKARSCYSASFVSSYWGYEGMELTEDQPLEWVRQIRKEYKRVRPYFSCDYYPLTEVTSVDSSWAASQYDRPEKGDGIVTVFRRVLSPCETARFDLGGIMTGASYSFEDADTGEIIKIGADELAEKGLVVAMPEKRSSKIYFYTVK